MKTFNLLLTYDQLFAHITVQAPSAAEIRLTDHDVNQADWQISDGNFIRPSDVNFEVET